VCKCSRLPPDSVQPAPQPTPQPQSPEVMGGRQSTQNMAHRHHHSPTQGSSRYSTASLDNGSLQARASGSIDFSSSDGRPVSRRRRRRDQNDQFIEAHSLPSHLFPFVTAEIKCPVCNKRIGTSEIESHLLACLSKPRVSYNEDTLKSDAGECIICFDDMIAGEHIARLPCLCIYHKKCLDEWFQRIRCCPAHPDQIPQEYSTDVSSTSSSLPHMDDTEGGSQQQAEAIAVASSAPTTSSRTSSRLDDNDQPSSPQRGAVSNYSEGVFQLTDDTEEDIINPFANHSNQNNVTNNETNMAETAHDSNNVNTHLESQMPDISTTTNAQGELDGPDTTSERNNDNLQPSATLAAQPDLNLNASTSSTGSNGAVAPLEDCGCAPVTISSGGNGTQNIGKHRTVVHVDDGSIHGSPNLCNDEEIEQLASKIKTILVQDSPRGVGTRTDYEAT